MWTQTEPQERFNCEKDVLFVLDFNIFVNIRPLLSKLNQSVENYPLRFPV